MKVSSSAKQDEQEHHLVSGETDHLLNEAFIGDAPWPPESWRSTVIARSTEFGIKRS